MTRKEEIELANKEHKYPLFSNYGDAFIAGAMWADKNPQSLWISVEDKFPYECKDMLRTDSYTYEVLVLNAYGKMYVAAMLKIDGFWIWLDTNKNHNRPTSIKYWMHLPKQPKTT